jgi:photosystem II stability/assembly factor-like uncharacterized protein
MKRILLFLLINSATFVATGQVFNLKKITKDIESSFRGLSVVDNNIAWVSGNRGWIGKTTDAGSTWDWMRIKNDSTADYRTLYAFDGMRAIVAGTGSPAKIFMTKDGGKNWKLTYINNHPEIFLDGIDFWNLKDGVIYGDPINGRLTILKTKNGGESWQLTADEKSPKILPGEASFAASGTTIRCSGKSDIRIGTGGAHSRLLVSTDKGTSWTVLTPPMVQGKSTQGIFSIAVNQNGRIMLTGGDFENPEWSTGHNLFSDDGGKSWKIPQTPTHGYRSCVEYLSENELIAVGPTGGEFSTDSGNNWQSLSDAPNGNTIRKSRKGDLILLSGKNGVWKILRD